MKIKVSDLEPNPFRKIKDYPIDKEKVEALKTSTAFGLPGRTQREILFAE